MKYIFKKLNNIYKINLKILHLNYFFNGKYEKVYKIFFKRYFFHKYLTTIKQNSLTKKIFVKQSGFFSRKKVIEEWKYLRCGFKQVHDFMLLRKGMGEIPNVIKISSRFQRVKWKWGFTNRKFKKYRKNLRQLNVLRNNDVKLPIKRFYIIK